MSVAQAGFCSVIIFNISDSLWECSSHFVYSTGSLLGLNAGIKQAYYSVMVQYT